MTKLPWWSVTSSTAIDVGSIVGGQKKTRVESEWMTSDAVATDNCSVRDMNIKLLQNNQFQLLSKVTEKRFELMLSNLLEAKLAQP